MKKRIPGFRLHGSEAASVYLLDDTLGAVWIIFQQTIRFVQTLRNVAIVIARKYQQRKRGKGRIKTYLHVSKDIEIGVMFDPWRKYFCHAP